MFNFRKKTGSAAINEAIGEFESIASRIETGVQENVDQVGANTETIRALEAENENLLTVANRGRSVAGKLRELIA